MDNEQEKLTGEELDAHAQKLLQETAHGVRLLLPFRNEVDGQRLIYHSAGATIKIDLLGLEFQSHTTAGKQMPMSLFVLLVHKDIRDNAMNISNVPDGQKQSEAHEKLRVFLDTLESLCDGNTEFDLEVTCLTGTSTIEGVEPERFELSQKEKLELLGYRVMQQ